MAKECWCGCTCGCSIATRSTICGNCGDPKHRSKLFGCKYRPLTKRERRELHDGIHALRGLAVEKL